MKNYLKHLTTIAGLVSALCASPAFATGNTLQCPQNNTIYVTSGGASYTSGTTGLATGVLSGKDVGSLLAAGCTAQGMQGDTVGASGLAGTLTIYPSTAAYGTLAITDTGNVGAYNTIINNAAVLQADTLTIPDPGSATASFLLTKGAQTITGVNTLGAGGGLVASTSTSTIDIAPPFDNRILGNPVAKVVSGTCLVAAVNGGTCIPLAGVASRTISVTHFDIIATGSAATCTGVLLEDTNGTPVVIATLAAATLTSGSHNVPLAATLGTGFGAGAGLTVAKGVQLIKNGSDCGTTTSFQYTITYAIQ